MHFIDPVFRPPEERFNPLLPITQGCTHNRCAFCTMYKDIPFQLCPLDQVEEDLREIAAKRPDAQRIYLLSANAFCLSYDLLAERIELIRRYLPELEEVSMFSRITDITHKTVDQLKSLRDMGVHDLYIGHESGDDWALAFVNKGYTAADILEQSAKLDEAGIRYRCTFLNGMVDREHSAAHAIHTAEVFSQLKDPLRVGSGSVVLFAGSGLTQAAERGEFVPLTEKERMEELRLFLQHLHCNTRFDTHHSSALMVGGKLPEDKQKMIDRLTEAIDNYEDYEEEMTRHRATIPQL